MVSDIFICPVNTANQINIKISLKSLTLIFN